MYCKYCGAKIDVTDRFCQNCGKENTEMHHHSYERSWHSYHTYEREVPIEPKEKLYCELAYTGFGFWLPLILGERNDAEKRIANQGLWTLIVSVIACNVIRILEYINLFFAGSLGYVISNAFYSFAYIAFLGFMFYLVYRCIVNVKAIHSGQEVKEIMFFDRVRLIR